MPNVRIGLLEILAYLFPGGLVLLVLLGQTAPNVMDKVMSQLAGQILFVSASYLVGHLLTMMSLAVVKLGALLKWLLRVKSREERLPFYPKLRANLIKRFGYQLSRDDEYHFSLRLVSEFLPRSDQAIDRLYALTLFSRNMVVALLFVTALQIYAGRRLEGAAILGLTAAFFFRYYYLERVTSNMVLRAAYVYFCSREEVMDRKAEHEAA